MTLAGICLIATALAWAGIATYYRGRCEKRVAVVRAKHAVDAAVEHAATQAHLRREWRTTAKLRLELRETKAELREKTRACAVHTEQWDRQYPLPTIDGNRADILDAIDTLGIGVVLSCADPIDPPIAAEARAAARAVVVPIEAGRR